MINPSTLYIQNKYQFTKLDENYIMEQVSNALHRSFKRFIKYNPPNASCKLYSNSKFKKDYSIYSGTGGNIYVYWRYHLFNKNKKFGDDSALNYMKDAFEVNFNLLKETENSKQFDILDQSTSFFHGPIGIYTMGCILAKETQDESFFIENLNGVLKYKKTVLSDYSEDELLYGNAGYLYSLSLIYKITTTEENFMNYSSIIQENLVDVIKYLFEIGSNLKKEYNTKFMVFPFPRINTKRKSSKFYLGGAHGIFGVLFEMLNAINLIEEINENLKFIKNEIKNDLFELSKFQFESGNFPSSLNKSADDLIQFCHGATGAVFLYGLAYEIFKEDLFLKVATRCGDTIWERGLLKKGNGVCHGITGNAYALFFLNKITNDTDWLYKAYCFTLATFDEDLQNRFKDNDPSSRLIKGIPDTPYSLMEGEGGTICLYSEILNNIKYVKLPGYEI